MKKEKIKKKIALIVDTDNWAFANNAKNVKEYLQDYYDFTIIPMNYLDTNFVRLFLLVKDYDLIHFFWRGHLMDIKNDFFEWYIKELGDTKENFEKNYIDYSKITTAVCDHLFVEEDLDISKDIFQRVKNYYVSSNKLLKIYNDLDIENKPTCVVTDGVSLEKFYTQNLERFDNIEDRKIVIGWCGNSNWAGKKEDYKGLKTILEPALDKLEQQGYKIQRHYADSQIKMIPHDEMVDYYKAIDILVCSSKMEGTPDPILEAMACGVPVVSTNVGIVPDAFGKLQKKYILKNRTVEDMEEKLKELIDNKEELKKLSTENLQSVKNWSWQKVANSFKKFFDKQLKNREKD